MTSFVKVCEESVDTVISDGVILKSVKTLILSGIGSTLGITQWMDQQLGQVVLAGESIAQVAL